VEKAVLERAPVVPMEGRSLIVMRRSRLSAE